MYAESSEIIPQPAKIVYPLVRDEMSLLVPYMPNVEKIDQLEYERTSDTRVEILNHWYAKVEVPRVVKSIVKPELFQWKDYANWKDDEWCVDYRLEGFVMKNLYHLTGTNYFTPKGKDKTEIKITFNLDIYPEKFPGVPKFLARRAKPVIEGMIKKMLTPNITSLAKGLNAYFADEEGKKKKPAGKKKKGK